MQKLVQPFRLSLLWALASILVALSTSAASSAEIGKPNIVFIFADDSGIDSYGCYGSDRFKSASPHIDALAKSGARFEHCYATPLCGPSRCVLQTGRYGFRTGGMSNQSASRPSFKEEPALARILKDAGYVTGMAGKWRQMSDSPGDWGYQEYVTDPTAGGYFWKNSYTKNGEQITTDKAIYYPDAASDFAVDFIRRHRDEPFHFYLSEHLIHGPILRTPDSNPDASPAQLYDDNLAYLDKTVGKLVSELDKLGLREKTLIVFTADNGTSRVGYSPEHDPAKTTGRIGGRHVHGMKGSLTEGGCRVPLIASWKGTLPEGTVLNDMIDFSDFLPTFAELAGAKLPESVKFDGHSFAPQLRGEKGKPREWVFVQLGKGWFARNDGWKLNEKGDLFSMKNAPFAEQPVPADTTEDEAINARKQLQAVLDELNPGGGKEEPPAKPRPKRKNRKRNPQQIPSATPRAGVSD